jgi:hypothetical protein
VIALRPIATVHSAASRSLNVSIARMEGSLRRDDPVLIQAAFWKASPAARGGRRRADIRIQAAMLGAETYAAIGIIPGSECQPIGPALLVIDIGEGAGIAAADSTLTRDSG